MDIGERQIRPLWLDEASTYWTTRESWLALLEQVGTDGSPPFYFVIVKAFTPGRCLGWLTIAVNATNLLNDPTPTFIGVPALGRMFMTRLQYTF